MFKPSTIYFEKAIENYDLGKELLEKYKDVPKVEIENHNNIEEMRKKSNKEFAQMKKNLIIGVRKTHKFVENHKTSDFLVPYTSSGCTAACMYCYLVCNYNKCAYLRLFVNREQMLEKIIKTAEKAENNLTFEIGSNSDLILENSITGNLKWTIENFKNSPKGHLTFPTKFDMVDDILDVDFFLSKDDNGNVIYWGWYSLSHLNGQMKQINIARGIRLRKENIQIGDEEICKKFFTKTTDQRFSFYYFGEIHAISKNLIPNSRRDYFAENDELEVFEQRVKTDFLKLREMCYDASDIKKSIQAIAKKDELEEKIKQKEERGYSSKQEQDNLQHQLKEYQKRSVEAQKKLERKNQKIEDSNSSLKKIINHLVPKIEVTPESVQQIQSPSSNLENGVKTKFRTDNPIYSQYTKAEKKLIGKIYASIAKAIPDERQREALIKFIEEDLTR